MISCDFKILHIWIINIRKGIRIYTPTPQFQSNLGLSNIQKMCCFSKMLVKSTKFKSRSPIQSESMLSYGHNGVISMDATFGTNDMKFHLFSLMGFDDHHMSVPLVWIITSRQTIEDLTKWLKPFKNKMLSHMPHWKPSCFLVDDAPQELKALQLVLYLHCVYFLRYFLVSVIKKFITSNAFYVVLTPSTHGDFIAYVSLLGLCGVWIRFPSSFVVGMFSKHGIMWYRKNQRCGGVGWNPPRPS